jgi:hypothetical protein
MSGTFAEIRQQSATPKIAAIYADIKTVSGLPFVNLIWRRLRLPPASLAGLCAINNAILLSLPGRADEVIE